jgi:hypothetical protein
VTKDNGRVGSAETGSRASTEPQSSQGLGPAGFDPARERAVVLAARRYMQARGVPDSSLTYAILRLTVSALDGKDEAAEALEDLRVFLSQKVFPDISLGHGLFIEAGDKFKRLENAIAALRSEARA